MSVVQRRCGQSLGSVQPHSGVRWGLHGVVDATLGGAGLRLQDYPRRQQGAQGVLGLLPVWTRQVQRGRVLHGCWDGSADLYIQVPSLSPNEKKKYNPDPFKSSLSPQSQRSHLSQRCAKTNPLAKLLYFEKTPFVTKKFFSIYARKIKIIVVHCLSVSDPVQSVH